MDTPCLNKEKTCDKYLVKLNGLNDIPPTPINRSIINDALNQRFAYVPYYLLIIKEGIIPPKY